MCDDHIRSARPLLKGATSLKVETFTTSARLGTYNGSKNNRDPHSFNSSSHGQGSQQTSSAGVNTNLHSAQSSLLLKSQKAFGKGAQLHIESKRDDCSNRLFSLPDLTSPKQIFCQSGASVVSKDSWAPLYKSQQDLSQLNPSSRIVIDTRKSPQSNAVFQKNESKIPSLASVATSILIQSDTDLKLRLKKQKSLVRQYSDNHGIDRIKNLIQHQNEIIDNFAQKIGVKQPQTERQNRETVFQSNTKSLPPQEQERKGQSHNNQVGFCLSSQKPPKEKYVDSKVYKNDQRSISNLRSTIRNDCKSQKQILFTEGETSLQISSLFEGTNQKQWKKQESNDIARNTKTSMYTLKQNELFFDFRGIHNSPNLTPIHNVMEEDVSIASFLLDELECK